ncbi:uncharacterized protein LOC135140783 [Zophobas morio]|uniref:uncharacterized protein LOC135140783 n=1 Tax=Zophobas morio TaxID=2755281 RepID=UPI00308397C8
MTVKILTDVLYYELSKAFFGGEVVSFEFVGQHNVWNERVKAMKKRSGRRGVDREVAISSRVVRDAPEKINWKLFLDLFFLKDPCRVKVIFRQKPGCFNVFHVCHCLYTKLVMFLEEIKDDPEEIGEVSVEMQSDDSDKKLVPEEEEDDDVPSDFFDDFANEDFLDGLDILDDKVAEVAKITKPDYHKENESNNKKGKQHKERSSVKDGCDDNRILQPGHALRERLRLRDERRERARSRIRLKSKSRFESRDRSKISSNSTVRKYITTTSRIVIKTRVRSRTPSPCRSKREKRSRSRECRSRRLPHRFTTRNRTRSPSPYTSKRRKRSRSPDYRSRRRSLSRGSNKSPTRRVLPQNSLLEEIKKKINEVKPRIALPRVQPVPMTRVPLIPNPPPLYNKNFLVATPVPYQQRVLAPIPLIPLPETTPSAETTQRDTSANHSVFAHLQKKAKVLRRCHDLTQFLNHNPRPTCLAKSLPKLSTSPRYQSPVKTALDLSFTFTSPPEQPVKDTYAEALHKVVEQAGMVKEVGVKRDKVVDKVTEVLETLKKALSDAVQKE